MAVVYVHRETFHHVLNVTIPPVLVVYEDFDPENLEFYAVILNVSTLSLYLTVHGHHQSRFGLNMAFHATFRFLACFQVLNLANDSHAKSKKSDAAIDIDAVATTYSGE